MDPSFHDLVRQELRRLLEDEDAARGPANPALARAVYAVLRQQRPDL